MDQYGRPSGKGTQALYLEISSQVILEQRHSQTQWSRDDLYPDWAAQCNRCIVPCKGTDRYEWLRKSPVITLGELFKPLGTDHTAKAIYAFYR